ncbi:MAG: hypothetical protein WC479_01640 [Candidatus Izemoplasmatales bacterium]|jgi:hypothetical protein|nr:hypothetical protein [Candidatus Izemoplasmatales bacterium]MDD3865874.1 hypothetical protein [Candidatus Izemoplasmatales bacterium]
MTSDSFFSTSCETKDLHPNPELRTRYYRNTFAQGIEAIKALAQTEKLEIQVINEIHKEVHIVGNGFDGIITFFLSGPNEMALDIKINWFGIIGWGKPRKIIISFYRFFDTVLQFIGVSLHP